MSVASIYAITPLVSSPPRAVFPFAVFATEPEYVSGGFHPIRKFCRSRRFCKTAAVTAAVVRYPRRYQWNIILYGIVFTCTEAGTPFTRGRTSRAAVHKIFYNTHCLRSWNYIRFFRFLTPYYLLFRLIRTGVNKNDGHIQDSIFKLYDGRV